MSGDRLDPSAAPPDDADAGSQPAHPAVDRTPVLIWVGFSLVSVLVRALAGRDGWSLDRWDPLAQWESLTHLSLAENGYEPGEFVMPGYALLVRSTQWVTGERLTAAVLITYAASGIASWLLWEWLAHRGLDRRVRIWAVISLLAFPYSFVLFGVVGPEALCLALLLATFVLLERDRAAGAGVAAAAATTVMVTGLAVLPALGVLAWSARQRTPVPQLEPDGGTIDPRASRGPLTALLIALLGPIIATAYAAWDSGDTWWIWRGDGAFAGLGNGVTRPATWVRLGWVFEDAPASWFAHRGAQVVCMVLCVVLAVWVTRRFGPAMGVLVVGVAVLTLIGYPDVASSARRLTAAFPVAALAGIGLARLPRPAAGTVVAVSAGLMFFFYVLYLRTVGLPFW